MSGATKRVLVTRAKPGASETARRLTDLGYAPIVEPVFQLEAIPALLPLFDALAFTSANGVRAFAGLSARRDARVYGVGKRTADAAHEAGFSDIRSADGDVEALLALIEKDLPPAASLLHAGNEESRGDLAARLKAAGRNAEFVATYRAVPVASPEPVLYEHLFGRPRFDAVLVHSPRAAEILASFLAAWPARAPIRAAAISPAAAASLRPLADRIETAAMPDEAGLLAALQILLRN